MRKTALTFISSAFLLTSSAMATNDIHWGYTGEASPEKWGTLDKKYYMCAEGKNQSPIDITGCIEAELPTIEFNYTSDAKEILNNGHTIQANIAPGSSINIEGIDFELKQFHFHSPSENHIYGESFPMEVHLVHADKEGNLAVIAVMFKENADNAVLEKLWSTMPEKVGDHHALESGINAINLLPEWKDYFRFSGSLTTPPCTEGVRWIVMKHPITISKKQVDRFIQVMHHPNARPLQNISSRPILK